MENDGELSILSVAQRLSTVLMDQASKVTEPEENKEKDGFLTSKKFLSKYSATERTYLALEGKLKLPHRRLLASVD